MRRGNLRRWWRRQRVQGTGRRGASRYPQSPGSPGIHGLFALRHSARASYLDLLAIDIGGNPSPRVGITLPAYCMSSMSPGGRRSPGTLQASPDKVIVHFCSYHNSRSVTQGMGQRLIRNPVLGEIAVESTHRRREILLRTTMFYPSRGAGAVSSARQQFLR